MRIIYGKLALTRRAIISIYVSWSVGHQNLSTKQNLFLSMPVLSYQMDSHFQPGMLPRSL